MLCRCPFCNTKFTRDPRSVLSNKFCSKCIEKRIKASRTPHVNNQDTLYIDKAGYGSFLQEYSH